MSPARSSALAAAVKLLAQRDYSERALGDKLARRAYSADEIDTALARLKERGYIDDGAYCAKLAQQLWRSGKWGLRGISSQLRRYGLPLAMIREAIAAFDQEEEAGHALALLEKRAFVADQKEKAGRFLEMRGFSHTVIEQSLNRFFSEY